MTKMSGDAKSPADRDIADFKHSQAIKALKRCIVAPTPNMRRILKNKKTVEDLYEVLIEKHFSYVGASKDLPEHQNWIDAKGDNNQNVLDEAEDVLDLIGADLDAGEEVRKEDMKKEEEGRNLVQITTSNHSIQTPTKKKKKVNSGLPCSAPGCDHVTLGDL